MSGTPLALCTNQQQSFPKLSQGGRRAVAIVAALLAIAAVGGAVVWAAHVGVQPLSFMKAVPLQAGKSALFVGMGVGGALGLWAVLAPKKKAAPAAPAQSKTRFSVFSGRGDTIRDGLQKFAQYHRDGASAATKDGSERSE